MGYRPITRHRPTSVHVRSRQRLVSMLVVTRGIFGERRRLGLTLACLDHSVFAHRQRSSYLLTRAPCFEVFVNSMDAGLRRQSCPVPYMALPSAISFSIQEDDAAWENRSFTRFPPIFTKLEPDY